MRRVLPLLQDRATGAFAISNAVAADVQPLLPRLTVHTVLNGVRTKFFDSDPVKAVDLDRLAGLPPSDPGTIRIGLVATYAAWKGHELFLEAASALRTLNARFYIVGGAVYATSRSQITQTALTQSIRTLGLDGKIGVVPFQLDMAHVYAALDIVVHASTRPEPFGRTVAEAMAAGRVVVAPNTGGIPEQIESGKTGVLYAPGNVQSLAASIAALHASPEQRRTIADAALQHARACLDAQRLAPQIFALYGAPRAASN
jgi:glycosyltransferase involved in cell wall biosynthesis